MATGTITHLSCLALWLALPLAACGEVAGDKPMAPPEYGACPDDLPGKAEGRDCATFQVPLRWDDAEGEHIELLVARYRAAAPATRQLWLLDGGPGGTGAAFMDPGVVAFYQQLGADLYIPQHRGTGHSTPLSCERGDISLATAPSAKLLADCGDELLERWGDGLQGFRSEEAGRDLGHLIAQMQRAEQRVFVFGVSYGSYWAQRYLQHFPEQADGVILQGVLPLSQPIWEGDASADRAGRSLLAGCRTQPTCLAALGGDPESAVARVVARANDPLTRCGGKSGADRQTLETWLGLLGGEANQFIPGLVRRLDRCSAEDAAELAQFGAVVAQIQQGASAANPALFNDVLGVHVLRSDLMASATSVPVASLTKARESLLFWSVTSPERLALYTKSWPVTYAAASSALPPHLSPIMMMSGGADMQTPPSWASALSSRLGAQLVEFPYVGHGVDFSLMQAAGGTVACSQAIERAFMDDPDSAVDTHCAASAYVPDFAGARPESAAMSQQLYGTSALLGSPHAM